MWVLEGADLHLLAGALTGAREAPGAGPWPAAQGAVGWARCGSPGHRDPACHLKGQRIQNSDLPPRTLLRAVEHLPGTLFKRGL